MSAEQANAIAERLRAQWNAKLHSWCWVWTGPCFTTGYGKVYIRRKPKTVHRVVWSEAHGMIPAGAHIHHKCDVKLCCNLAHLEALTPKEHKQKHRPTSCPHGHPYEGPGSAVYVRKNGHRRCAHCERRRARERMRALRRRELLATA